MQINKNDNIIFGSRCKAVKAGQQACLAISKNFPGMSATLTYIKAENLRESRKFSREINIYLHNLLEKIYNQRLDYSYGSGVTRVSELIKSVKENNILDCGERAILADVILKQNGYNSRRANLTANGNIVDHEFCCFNVDNSVVDKVSSKTIIVDPWLGICDLASEIFARYRGEFGKYLNRLSGLNDKSMDNLKFNIFAKGDIMTGEELRGASDKIQKFMFPEKFRANFKKN